MTGLKPAPDRVPNIRISTTEGCAVGRCFVVGSALHGDTDGNRRNASARYLVRERAFNACNAP